MSFWGQLLVREEELAGWRSRLDGLKTFTESLRPYNTVGKLKNLRITAEETTPRSKTGARECAERLR